MIRTTAPVLIVLLIGLSSSASNGEMSAHVLDVRFQRVVLRASYRTTKDKMHLFTVQRVYMGVWTEKEVRVPAFHWRNAWGDLVVDKAFVMSFSNNPNVDAVYQVKAGLIQVTLGGYENYAPKWLPFSEIEALLLHQVQRHVALQLGPRKGGPLMLPEPKYQNHFRLQNLGTRTLSLCITPRHFGFYIERKTDKGYRYVRSSRAPKTPELSRKSFVELKPRHVIPVTIPDELVEDLAPGNYRIRVHYSNTDSSYQKGGEKVRVEDVWIGERQTQWVPFIVAGKKKEGADKKPPAPQEDAAKVHADFRRLVAIHRKSERKDSRGDAPVTTEERAYVIKTLDRQTGLWFAHDFPRMAAITAGNLRAREAVPKLIKLLSLRRKHYDMVNAEAAAALGKIGNSSALPHLFTALVDDRTWLRLHAAKAIHQIAKKKEDSIDRLRTPERFNQAVKILSGLQLPTEAEGRIARSELQSSNPAWYLALNVDALRGIVLLMAPKSLSRFMAYERRSTHTEGSALLSASMALIAALSAAPMSSPSGRFSSALKRAFFCRYSTPRMSVLAQGPVLQYAGVKCLG